MANEIYTNNYLIPVSLSTVKEKNKELQRELAFPKEVTFKKRPEATQQQGGRVWFQAEEIALWRLSGKQLVQGARDGLRTEEEIIL